MLEVSLLLLCIQLLTTVLHDMAAVRKNILALTPNDAV